MPAVDMIDTKAKQNLKMNTIDGAFAAMSDNLQPFPRVVRIIAGSVHLANRHAECLPHTVGQHTAAALRHSGWQDIKSESLDRYRFAVEPVQLALDCLSSFLGEAGVGVSILIVLATLRVVGATLGVPAWIAIQAEIVPKPIRGRHYANRNIIMNIVALAAVLFAGKILTLRYPVNYRILFVLAWITGLVSLWAFLQIKVQQAPQSTRTSAAQREKRGFSLRHNKDFAYYCLAFLCGAWE